MRRSLNEEVMQRPRVFVFEPDQGEVERKCKCLLCDAVYTEWHWRFDEPQLCRDCFKHERIGGFGFKSTLEYIGGGNRVQLLSASEAMNLDILAFAIRRLDEESKCKICVK
ncbi:MAG: hypothetical protein AAFU85_30665 [Planctomycetota bacterium]